MQEQLTELLKGAQRVPSLLVLNPTQSLRDLNLMDYEVVSHYMTHTPIIYFKRSRDY